MSSTWAKDAIVYHIYPLGLCGAPSKNDFVSAPLPRLNTLYDWLPHMQSLGANTIYLGPIFESSAHGYDTADYFQIDRRLGTNEDFKALAKTMKRMGFRIVLDAVFNHVGRDFWAFRDVQAHGQNSAYREWFAGLDFSKKSPFGDPFYYEGWAGHYDLVKLNLENPAVQNHLFEAVSFWIDEFDIDGLRLDAADHITPSFFRALREHCDTYKADFWLMGEVVHGDYTKWANNAMLDSTTNYEGYKGLYSSHNDCNYFEIAYSLNRQFGAEGMYRDLFLYNFADNHDVDRVASTLNNPAHLYPLYGLLFTMPGIPSIYYGSEWGLTGKRTPHSDKALRPALDLHQIFPQPQLAEAIQQLAHIRQNVPALRYGSYCQVHIAHEQFAFERAYETQKFIVAVNASTETRVISLQDIDGHHMNDLLNAGETFDIHDGQVSLPLYANWLRILEVTP